MLIVNMSICIKFDPINFILDDDNCEKHLSTVAGINDYSFNLDVKKVIIE